MMKTVMRRAWNLARVAEKLHGGKASEYISSTMKTAWAGMKKQGLNKFRTTPVSTKTVKKTDMSNELSIIVEKTSFVSNSSVTMSQAGAVYINFKQGNLDLTKKEISFMYDNLVEIAEYPNPQQMEINFFFKLAVDLVFNGQFDLAAESLRKSINVFNVFYDVKVA